MNSINEVKLLGNITKDPELRYTPGGIAVVKFSMATNKKVKTKDSDEYTDVTQFHNVVFWRHDAEFISKYLGKGSRVLVSGEIQYRMYEKEGVKHYITEIVGNYIISINSKNGQEKKEVIPGKTDSAGNEIEDIVIPDDFGQEAPVEEPKSEQPKKDEKKEEEMPF